VTLTSRKLLRINIRLQKEDVLIEEPAGICDLNQPFYILTKS